MAWYRCSTGQGGKLTVNSNEHVIKITTVHTATDTTTGKTVKYVVIERSSKT